MKTVKITLEPGQLYLLVGRKIRGFDGKPYTIESFTISSKGCNIHLKEWPHDFYKSDIDLIIEDV